MKHNNLLLKGFEVELFTGLATGEHYGVSDSVSKSLDNFVQEPDKRNIEYITSPNSEYNCLKNELIAPRKKVREWLSERNLTLLPGSTLKRIDDFDLLLPVTSISILFGNDFLPDKAK